MAIRAALFDMDGTIWESPVDWMQVRQAIGVPPEARTIISYLSTVSPEERARGMAVLERYEASGVEAGCAMPGANELVAFLRSRGVPTALVTNNSRASASATLDRIGCRFDRVFTREDGALKPDPEALLAPLRALGFSPDEAVALGDSFLDLAAAHGAGIREIVLVAPKAWSRSRFPAGAVFHEVTDLFAARKLLECLLDGRRPRGSR
jgi:HAD superfamily hydrolase (TIGR01509 family)